MAMSFQTEFAARHFLLRHGESVANVERRIASSLTNAGSAFGLTPRGRGQVRTGVTGALAEGTLRPPCRVVSSPLLRALETAAIAAEIVGAEVEVDARLIERGFGSFELLSDENYDQVWSADRQDHTHQLGGVESVASILGRAAGLLHELDLARDGRPVLLCTHGDVASVLLCASQGVPVGRHRDVGALANGEVRAVGSAVGRAWPLPTVEEV
jgi:probable phosphoglycerate mutase